MQSHLLPSGYLYVALRKTTPEGKRKRFNAYVHRFVLEAFVGPCPPQMEARHLNGDRGDNRLDNLAWGTRAENAADSLRHGTRVIGSKHTLAKLSEENVAAMIAGLEAGMTVRQAAALYGVSRNNVIQIRTGQRWRHVARTA